MNSLLKNSDNINFLGHLFKVGICKLGVQFLLQTRHFIQCYIIINSGVFV